MDTDKLELPGNGGREEVSDISRFGYDNTWSGQCPVIKDTFCQKVYLILIKTRLTFINQTTKDKSNYGCKILLRN